MATSDILPFAQGVGANVDTQAAYAANAQRQSGQQPGIARSAFNNKALLQSSVMAATLGKFIADNQANNVSDGETLANLSTWFGDALRAQLGVTAPQFDNDTSLATTAFVQRAIGSFNSYAGMGASRSLTVADIGRTLFCNTPGAALTLPTPTSLGLLPGSSFNLFSGNSASGSLVQGAGATLNSPAGNVGNFSFLAGQSFTVVAVTTTTWQVVSSTAALGENASFGALLAANGYQKLPSGLILQWGAAGAITNGGNVTVTLPIAFPTGAFMSIAGAGLASAANAVLGVQVLSPSQIRIFNGGTATSADSPWIAIGR